MQTLWLQKRVYVCKGMQENFQPSFNNQLLPHFKNVYITIFLRKLTHLYVKFEKNITL